MKRSEQFLDSFGDIREEWIEDAELAGKTVPLWAKALSAAAIICLILATFSILLSPKSETGGDSLTSTEETAASDAGISIMEPEPEAPAEASALQFDSPYLTLGGDSITYEKTQWGMSKEEVIAAQGLHEDQWDYISNFSARLRATRLSSFPPGVVQIIYEFHTYRLDQLFSLSRVWRAYDPAAVTFDALRMQRTEELGAPTSDGKEQAIWRIGDTTLTLEQKTGSLLEVLEVDMGIPFYEALTVPGAVETYIRRLSPPFVVLGQTWSYHMEQGLLRVEDGAVFETEYPDGSPGYVLTLPSELNGIPVTAEYWFGTTPLTPEGDTVRYALKAVMYTPEDQEGSQALETAVDAAMSEQMVKRGDRWVSLDLGNLTTQPAQAIIAKAILADGSAASLEEAVAGLYEWPVVSVYWNEDGKLEYNGTGAALYLDATRDAGEP